MSSGDSGDDEHEECHCHDEPWLVSYADLMTLLFGFFVILYAFAAAKLENLPETPMEDMIPMRKEIAQYFGGEYITPLDQVAEKFKSSLEGADKGNSTQIDITPEGLDITFQSIVLFRSGKASINSQASKSLKLLAKLVLEEELPYKVVVEGHSDSAPIATKQYPSNWQLSSARASAIVHLFEKQGFNPKSLQAVGYGESRPILPNKNEQGAFIPENMAKNRRIRIKVAILQPPK